MVAGEFAGDKCGRIKRCWNESRHYTRTFDDSMEVLNGLDLVETLESVKQWIEIVIRC